MIRHEWYFGGFEVVSRMEDSRLYLEGFEVVSRNESIKALLTQQEVWQWCQGDVCGGCGGICAIHIN